jgi:uridine monophosphate synthetase
MKGLAASASSPSDPLPSRTFRLSYGARAQLAKNALARQCLELMERKKTNLSVAADVDTAEEMLELADKVRTGLGWQEAG